MKTWPNTIFLRRIPPISRGEAKEEKKEASAALSHGAASTRGAVMAAELLKSKIDEVPRVERSEPPLV